MSRNSKLTIGIATIWLASVLAISAQDKYAVKVPNGLPFSDFKGYEDWQIVAVSQTDDLLKAMVANPTMIAAYKSGIPGNGRPFPDGSKKPPPLCVSSGQALLLSSQEVSPWNVTVFEACSRRGWSFFCAARPESPRLRT